MKTSCAHFDKLLGQAGQLVDQARRKRLAKDYAGAVELVEQAINMLNNAKPFQQVPKEELAEINLAEAHYHKALDPWQPIYNANGMPTDIACGMAIAYAKTDRVEEAVKILGVLYNLEKKLVPRSIDVRS